MSMLCNFNIINGKILPINVCCSKIWYYCRCWCCMILWVNLAHQNWLWKLVKLWFYAEKTLERAGGREQMQLAKQACSQLLMLMYVFLSIKLFNLVYLLCIFLIQQEIKAVPDNASDESKPPPALPPPPLPPTNDPWDLGIDDQQNDYYSQVPSNQYQQQSQYQQVSIWILNVFFLINKIVYEQEIWCSKLM